MMDVQTIIRRRGGLLSASRKGSKWGNFPLQCVKNDRGAAINSTHIPLTCNWPSGLLTEDG